jgi:hypothetical protein
MLIIDDALFPRDVRVRVLSGGFIRLLELFNAQQRSES